MKAWVKGGLIVVVILAIILISFAFTEIDNSSKSEAETLNLISSYSSNPESQKVLSENPNLCKNLGDESIEDICFLIIAIDKGDIGYCSKISKFSEETKQCSELVKSCENTKKKCIESYINFIGSYRYGKESYAILNPRNESVCVNQTNETHKAYCYRNLAKSTGNVSYCALSDNISYCKYGVAITFGNETLCLETGSEKESCFYNIAKDFGKLSLCLNLSNYSRSGCISIVTRGTLIDKNSTYPIRPNAYKNGDIFICSSITEERSVVPEQCYYGLIKNLGLEICNKLSGKDLARCYFAYAKNTGEVSKCELIPDSIQYDNTTTSSDPWANHCVSMAVMEYGIKEGECEKMSKNKRACDNILLALSKSSTGVKIFTENGSEIIHHYENISEDCIKENEVLHVSDQGDRVCCDDLIEVAACRGGIISVGDKCYEDPNMPAGCMSITCEFCGNGVCGKYEDLCSCREDCLGVKEPNYSDIQTFCEEAKKYSFCQNDNDYELCNICNSL